MIRKTLLSVALLSLTATAAQAADATTAGSGTASASASASMSVDRAAAKQAAADAKNAAINAGLGALTSGKTAAASAAEAGKAAAQNATDSAKALAAKASESGTAAKDGVAGKLSSLASKVQLDAAKRISIKDRAALVKHFITNRVLEKLAGTTAEKLPVGYRSSLKVGGTLDANLQKLAVDVDESTVVGLGPQPEGTNLLIVGKTVVRVDVKTNVILDVSLI